MANLDAARLLDQRRPYEELEAAVVRLSLAHPTELHTDAVDALLYVIRFARLQTLRCRDGKDHELGSFLAPHAWKVRTALTPYLIEHPSLWGAMRVLPDLVAETRERRRRMLEHFDLDAESLEAELRSRPLVVVCGGGGGAGYGYAGAWTLFHRHGLQPELIAGTSIGALMSLFRARRRFFDGAPMVAAARRLTWEGVFRVLESDNQYGLPATLRLYLRTAIGHLFLGESGKPLTFADMEIPLLIVATGIGVEALKHDLSYYEHFLDDAVSPGRRARPSRLAKMTQWLQVMRELVEAEEALHEVVFGADPATYDADVLDAAGFSASIPGLIHYDVLRDDKRMKHLLDELYARYGITRLIEGGVVNNVPVRPAFAEVMAGRIKRRDPYIVALDCFAPRVRSLVYLPIQQLVRPNVQANMPYANFYFSMDKTLSPLNMVPPVEEVTQAMDWTMAELAPHMPMIERHIKPIRGI